MYRTGIILVICIIFLSMLGCGGSKSGDIEAMKKDIADLKTQLSEYKNQNAEVMKQTSVVINQLKEALVKVAEAKRQSDRPISQPNQTKSRTDILEEERIREEVRRAEHQRDECTRSCRSPYRDVMEKCIKGCAELYNIVKPR